MEKFNIEKYWNDFICGKMTVNCKSEELAKEFLKYCHENNMKWGGGYSLLSSDTEWNVHKSETCYWGRDDITCSSIDYCRNCGVNVIEFTGLKNEFRK